MPATEIASKSAVLATRPSFVWIEEFELTFDGS